MARPGHQADFQGHALRARRAVPALAGSVQDRDALREFVRRREVAARRRARWAGLPGSSGAAACPRPMGGSPPGRGRRRRADAPHPQAGSTSRNVPSAPRQHEWPGRREASSTGLRLVNPVPQGHDGNSERASNGGPKERARVEVTVPQPLHSGPGGEGRQEHDAAVAPNKLPGRTSSQPTAHEFARLPFLIWRSPRYRHRLRRIACQGSLDSQQPIRLLWLPGYAGRNLAARGRLTLPLVAQH